MSVNQLFVRTLMGINVIGWLLFLQLEKSQSLQDPEEYLRNSKTNYRRGEVEESLKDVRQCLKLDHDHKKCSEQYKRVKRLLKLVKDAFTLVVQESYSDALEMLKAALEVESKESVYLIQLNQKICHCYLKKKQATEAIETCTEVLKLDENNFNALHDRGETHLLHNNYAEAISDFHAAKLVIGNSREASGDSGKPDEHLRVSKLYYRLGDANESLKETRQCLKLDLDSKKCSEHYSKVKKLAKFLNDASDLLHQQKYNDAIIKFKSALKVEAKEKIYIIHLKQKICHCFLQVRNPVEAIKTCSEVLKIDKSNLDALCDRGEAYISIS